MVYKTTKKQRDASRKYYKDNIEKYRKYKKEYMRARRSDPEINNKIKARSRKWYKESGRIQRQKAYLTNMRENEFMKWRTRLFNAHYKTTYKEFELQAIWDRQDGKCYFTGEDLDKTANLDHIVPIKRGGGHDLVNLRWTTKQVNFMKRDMLDEEFIKVMKVIINKLIS